MNECETGAWQTYRERYALKAIYRRCATRLRRSVKRRMRGETHRKWLERNLLDSEAGVALDLIQCFLSLLMVQAIIDQNWANSSYTNHESAITVDVMNLFGIIVNFCLRWYATSNRKGFLLHWLSLSDLCCVPALTLELLSTIYTIDNNKYLFRFLLMARTTRILQLYRLLRLAKTAKSRQSCLIGLTTICIIVCAAVSIQTIEYCDPAVPTAQAGINCQDLTFLDSVYFVCITIGTVGYGDVAPKTRVGKVVDICLIMFTGVLIPIQLSGYTDIISRETAFDKRYIPDKSIEHVLLCGDIENTALRFFLHNWLHTEGGDRENRRKVIILSPMLPSSALRRILIHREYEQRVIYLQGSAMATADLQRAAASTAAYCFIMVKKHSETLDQNDTAVNLLTCSVRKNNDHAPLYVQVSKYDNYRHVDISGASAVVCLEQLRLAMLGKSLWIRGFNSFMGNLIQKFGGAEETRGFWLSDYLTGSVQSIYEAAIPVFLFTMPTFRSLAVLIYREFGVPILGLRTIEETVILYPVDQDLCEVNFQSIFFIGKTKDIALKIEKMSATVLTHHTDILPNMEAAQSKTNLSMTGILAAMENKLPFRSMSIGFNDEGISMASSRVSQNRTSIGRMMARGVEKIIPLDGGSHFHGDFTSFQHSHSRRHSERERPHGLSHNVALQQRLVGQVSEYEDSRLIESSYRSTAQPIRNILPVVALTPAELVKKATSLVSPRSGVETAIRPLSNRSAYSGRESGQKSPSSKSCRNLVQDTNNETEASETTSMNDPYPNDLVGTESIQENSNAFHNDSNNTSALLRNDSTTVLYRDSVAERKKRSISSRLRRASIFRSISRKSPPVDLANHYVVCGIPSNYADLLANLRDVDEELIPVVFITSRELTEKDYQAYLLHKDIYFIRGSPVNMHVLQEARMVHARGVLIMSYCGMEIQENQNEMEHTDENMADVDAITTHRFISEICQNAAIRTRGSIVTKQPSPFIVAEMIRPSNVKFLTDSSSSLYNEQATDHSNRRRDLLKEAEYLDESFLSPLYASGHIYFSNFVDALIGSSSHSPLFIDMIAQLIISGNMRTNLPDQDSRLKHRLLQIPAPVCYHFRPYGILVEGLLHNENTMALGIFRGGNSHISPAYVFTNPTPDELIAPHDYIFVIK